LSHQDLYADSVKLLDQAIACDASYSNALKARGDAKMSLDDLEGAAKDYELAQKAGDASANLAGSLAWTYYLMGRFDDAVVMNETALKFDPNELWIRFDLALANMAKGNFTEARTEYQKGMETAVGQVSEARKNGAEPPSDLWWALDDAAVTLDNLTDILDLGEGSPAPDTIQKPDEVRAAATDNVRALKSLAVALEYSGEAPKGDLSAQVSAFVFSEPVMNDAGEGTSTNETDSFAYGADEVSVLFDYSGMKEGQDVVFKVYIDDEEDPSWRIAEPWSLGESGSAEKALSFAYSNTRVLRAGEYTIEMYVDYQLAQRGSFWISEE